MQKLRQQARNVTFGIIVFSAYAYFFLSSHYEVFREYAETGALLGITWTVIPVVLIYGYEALFWRWFNTEIDFSGYWDFTETQYELGPSGDMQRDYSAWGHMRVVQDTRSISIVEGQTNKEVSSQDIEQEQEISAWWSEACDLDAKSKLIMAAIGHKSSGLRVGGAVQFGVEVISISRTGRLNRPLELSSMIYHCIGYGQPRIVQCHYVRRRRNRTPPAKDGQGR